MVKSPVVNCEVVLRTDAQANRDRILEVARQAFAADPETSLNAIAKAAGVGAGTLYRHFPNREELLAGVYHKEIATLIGLAPTLMATSPPLPAFRHWCERFAQFGEVKSGMADALHAAISDQELENTYGSMVEVVNLFLQACEIRGDVRGGNKPEDVLALLSPLVRIPSTPGREGQAKRLLDIIFCGLGAKLIDNGS